MNQTLSKLKDLQSECCISILLNTHRTKPDYQQDVIILKNLVNEAEKRLYKMYDKRFAKSIFERLTTLAKSIDHSLNIESLCLFVNEEISEIIRLPVSVKERVIIDTNFATRDIIRAIHKQTEYFVLILSRDEARLIEAFNEKVVQEITGIFPIENNSLYTTDTLKKSMTRGQDNLIEEFFSRVDKAVNDVLKENPVPLIVVTEERNFHHYKKVSNYDKIVAHLNKNRNVEKAHRIIEECWPIVLEDIMESNNKKIKELNRAVSSQSFLSDINDIWRAVNEKRGKILYVGKEYFQAAKIENNLVILLDAVKNKTEGYIDDIVDEIIEINQKFGGDTVFLPEEELEDFQGIALITRY